MPPATHVGPFPAAFPPDGKPLLLPNFCVVLKPILYRMLYTQIIAAGKSVQTPAVLYLAKKNQDWEKLGFSAKEIDFIHRKIQDEKKLIIVPRVDEAVFIQLEAGKKETFQDLEEYRQNGAAFGLSVNAQKMTEATVTDVLGDKHAAMAIAEGIALGNYQFLKYRKEAEKEKNSLHTILLSSKKLDKTDILRLQETVNAVCIARDLVNEPLSFLDAIQLSKEFEALGHDAGFKVEVLNKTKIESLKMGGLLAVNRGSITPPTFSILEYKPAKAINKKPIVLVGKGVVYDTGGLSLKPTANSMDYMKCDMAGAATVACALYGAAKMQLPLHIVALVPATDNRPGEDAYVPGDVVDMHNGMRVEVLNTDAEGRMLLADALSYARKFKPEVVFDFATLTGAAAAAIGHYGIVYMGTADDKTKQKLRKSGENVYERLVEFPMWDEYNDLIKSDIADLKNIGGPVAGAITAGKFLEHFTDYPWLHFDIAGPAYVQKNDSYRSKNASGTGVRLLLDYFINASEK